MDLTSCSPGIRVRNLVQGVIWWDNILQALGFFWLVCCNCFGGRLLNLPEDYPNFQSLKVWIVIKHLIWWGLLDVLLVYWQLGGNTSIFLPASLAYVQAQKAGIYLGLAELPARPQKMAPNLCILGRLKPNSKEAWLFWRSWGDDNLSVTNGQWGILVTHFIACNCIEFPIATNDSNQDTQQGSNYFISWSSRQSASCVTR